MPGAFLSADALFYGPGPGLDLKPGLLILKTEKQREGLMCLLLVLSTVAAFMVKIDDVANKKVQIVFPAYPEYFLAHNMADFGNRPFAVANSDMESSFNTFSKINHDGDHFEITVGEEKLCKEGEKIAKCWKKPDLWKIVPVHYGFNIKKDGRCLTVREDGLLLEECRMAKRQLVDFRIVPGIFQCIERAGNLLGPPTTDEEKRVRRLLGKKLSQTDKKALQNLKNGLLNKPKTFEDFAKKKLPGLKGKKKMKDLLKKLWNKTHRWKFPGINLRAWLNFFCPL